MQTSLKRNTFYIFASTNLMKYSLFHLLNNSLKFSKEFGYVVINILSSDSSISVEVIDVDIIIVENK